VGEDFVCACCLRNMWRGQVDSGASVISYWYGHRSRTFAALSPQEFTHFVQVFWHPADRLEERTHSKSTSDSHQSWESFYKVQDLTDEAHMFELISS